MFTISLKPSYHTQYSKLMWLTYFFIWWLYIAAGKQGEVSGNTFQIKYTTNVLWYVPNIIAKDLHISITAIGWKRDVDNQSEYLNTA